MELIKVNALPADFGDNLHPFVRSRYTELWNSAQVEDPYEE